jgi:hypothetical protein
LNNSGRIIGHPKELVCSASFSRHSPAATNDLLSQQRRLVGG